MINTNYLFVFVFSDLLDLVDNGSNIGIPQFDKQYFFSLDQHSGLTYINWQYTVDEGC